MEYKLKPCPFCGGTDVEIRQSRCIVTGVRYWYILHLAHSQKCPLTDAWGEWYSNSKFTTREKAIQAWNRRVEADAN